MASLSILLYIKPSTLSISGTEAELQVNNLCLLLDISIDAKNVPLACGPLLLSLLSPKPPACFSPLALDSPVSIQCQVLPKPSCSMASPHIPFLLPVKGILSSTSDQSWLLPCPHHLLLHPL